MFLRGETGAKLARRLRNAALALNAGAVQRAEPWRNGQAAGYMLAASDIQALAGVAEAGEGEDEERG